MFNLFHLKLKSISGALSENERFSIHVSSTTLQTHRLITIRPTDLQEPKIFTLFCGSSLPNDITIQVKNQKLMKCKQVNFTYLLFMKNYKLDRVYSNVKIEIPRKSGESTDPLIFTFDFHMCTKATSIPFQDIDYNSLQMERRFACTTNCKTVRNSYPSVKFSQTQKINTF